MADPKAMEKKLAELDKWVKETQASVKEAVKEGDELKKDLATLNSAAKAEPDGA